MRSCGNIRIGLAKNDLILSHFVEIQNFKWISKANLVMQFINSKTYKQELCSGQMR